MMESDSPWECLPEALVANGVGQVGILVPNLEEGLRTYGAIRAIESWSIYTYGPEVAASMTIVDPSVLNSKPSSCISDARLPGDATEPALAVGPSAMSSYIICRRREGVAASPIRPGDVSPTRASGGFLTGPVPAAARGTSEL